MRGKSNLTVALIKCWITKDAKLTETKVASKPGSKLAVTTTIKTTKQTTSVKLITVTQMKLNFSINLAIF